MRGLFLIDGPIARRDAQITKLLEQLPVEALSLQGMPICEKVMHVVTDSTNTRYTGSASYVITPVVFNGTPQVHTYRLSPPHLNAREVQLLRTPQTGKASPIYLRYNGRFFSLNTGPRSA